MVYFCNQVLFYMQCTKTAVERCIALIIIIMIMTITIIIIIGFDFDQVLSSEKYVFDNTNHD